MADELKLTPEMIELLRNEAAENKLHVSRWGTCLCGKLVVVEDYLRKYHSGRFFKGKQITPGINYTALLCDDCVKEFAEWSRIVCLGCKDLMGFYKPGRQATGFVFEKRRHYHIVDCPKCNPRRPATPVLEHEQFCKERGIKTDTAQDLLQEIETKILQAEAEAARLRAEFQASKRK